MPKDIQKNILKNEECCNNLLVLRLKDKRNMYISTKHKSVEMLEQSNKS